MNAARRRRSPRGPSVAPLVEEAELIHRPEASWTGPLYASPMDVAAFVPNVDVCTDGQLLRVGKINVVDEKDAGLPRNGTQLDLYC